MNPLSFVISLVLVGIFASTAVTSALVAKAVKSALYATLFPSK